VVYVAWLSDCGFLTIIAVSLLGFVICVCLCLCNKLNVLIYFMLSLSMCILSIIYTVTDYFIFLLLCTLWCGGSPFSLKLKYHKITIMNVPIHVVIIS
jgi:hypothetical protein